MTQQGTFADAAGIAKQAIFEEEAPSEELVFQPKRGRPSLAKVQFRGRHNIALRSFEERRREIRQRWNEKQNSEKYFHPALDFYEACITWSLDSNDVRAYETLLKDRGICNEYNCDARYTHDELDEL